MPSKSFPCTKKHLKPLSTAGDPTAVMTQQWKFPMRSSGKAWSWNYNNFKADIGAHPPTKRQQRGLDYYGKLMPVVYAQDWFGFMTLIRKMVCFIKGFNNPFARISGSSDQKVVVHKSCALAAQTFMLGISAHGYDTCPMEGFDSKRVKKLMGLPAGAEINMIVSIGKGTEKGIHGERKRLPFEEVVFVR